MIWRKLIYIPFAVRFLGLWKISFWVWCRPKCSNFCSFCKRWNASEWLFSSTMWWRWIDNSYSWSPKSWGLNYKQFASSSFLFESFFLLICLSISGLDCARGIASTLWIIKSGGTENDNCGEYINDLHISLHEFYLVCLHKFCC